MHKKIKSEGKCLFCSKTFAKAKINPHLATHLEEKAITERSGSSFLVNVETDTYWGVTPYFLSLWIDGDTTMKTIDKFLRDIWLECCGHLSKFHGAGMAKKAKDVFEKGVQINYAYDYGSTTALTLTVIGEYAIKSDEKIVLLSRNEPFEIICSICKKAPATQICMVCMYDEDAEFCDQCAKKHTKKCEDFDEEYSLPLVNSPRMGVCGYEGGVIDTERDGIFVLRE